MAANTVKLTQDVQKINTSLGGITSMAGKMAGALGIGFSVGAVVSFGKAIFADADALQRMSDKTGIASSGLQRLQRAGDDAGNTLDEMTNGITQMQNRLAGNDKSAVGALERLHLKLTDLKQLGPDRQFMAISDAIRGVKDPADQVNIAMAIFGRQGASILPVIKRGFDDVKNSAVGMSDESVKALDEVGDSFGRMWRTIKGGVGDSLGRFLEVSNETRASMWTFEASLSAVTNTATAAAPHLTPEVLAPASVPANLKSIVAGLNDEREALDEAKKAAAKVAEENKRFRDSVESLTSSAIGARQAFGAYGALMPDLSAQTVQFADRHIYLASALDATAASVDALGREGRHTSAVLAGMGDQALIGSLMPALEGSGKAIAEATAKSKGFGGVLTDLFTNSSKTVGGWQESLTSKITGLFGGKEGGVMGKVIGGGMNMIFGPAGGLISSLMSQGMAKMGELALAGLKKIGGYFKDLFGGPSAKELAGREVVDAFEQHLSTMLTDAQRMEAGNDAWKQTVVVVRDAYLALGKTEAEALAAVNALWASSKGGADAVRDAMKPIEDALQGVGNAANTTIGILKNIPPKIEVDVTYKDPGIEAHEAPEGFAHGTGGRFLDFGRGTPVMLHGRERVMTEAEGRSGAGGMFLTREEWHAERVFLTQIIPRAIKAALQQAA